MAAILDSQSEQFQLCFDLQVSQVSLMLPTNWPFGSGEEAKNKFSRWPPGLQIGRILAIFDLHITKMLPGKFHVNWSFDSGEEAKNRFSRWPSWISDQNAFSFFRPPSYPDASYQVSSQLAFWFRRSKKNTCNRF